MSDLLLYLLQVLLLPDVLCYIHDILYSLLLRLILANWADSNNITGAPRPNSPQDQDLPTVPQHCQAPVAASRQSLLSQGLTQHPRSPFPQSQNRKKGMFYQASDFLVSGTPMFIDNNADNANININNSDKFMAELLQETIPGAAFDSSIRDPPPRCHPGTRLAILRQCLTFIVNCTNEKKIRWVFGAAGVGKSAIMQSIAEYPLDPVPLRASIFFFVNGRSDGSKTIVTLAYQLAVQCETYRQFIKHEIAQDPSLLQKSMSVQFNRFIVEPFIHHPQLHCAGRVLIIIDGLDECDKSRTQRELLRLVSDCCLTYPSSPIVWVIASRPEPHIVSFFAQAHVDVAYEKEEILVDYNEAREDVERFLRTELRKIRDEFLLHTRVQWPSEQDFWELANASGGLFVYAHAVVKYVGDPDIGDPTAQLKDVLQVIDAHPLANVPREEHPMAFLDALYARILSKVPTKVRENLRKLLLALVFGYERICQICDPEGRNFIVLCNWLGMTCDEAYAALRHLSSVLDVPRHDKAHMEIPRCFHKSFIDYISDFSRSGFLLDIEHNARQLFDQCTFRILEQAPGGIDVGDLNYDVGGMFAVGTLARGSGTGSNISLTWTVDAGSDWDDNRTRLFMYKAALASVANEVAFGEPALCTMSCIRLLATRLDSLTGFTAQVLSAVVFYQPRRHEITEQGLLQKIPIKLLDISDIMYDPLLQFRRPTTPNTKLSNPWNPSCIHSREGEWGEGKNQAWFTRIKDDRGSFACGICCQRFEHQLESWKTQLPDYPVSVLFTSAGVGFVEFQFVDPEDGISEWTYRFCHKFGKEECIKLGCIV